jgi:hypothetical protein
MTSLFRWHRNRDELLLTSFLTRRGTSVSLRAFPFECSCSLGRAQRCKRATRLPKAPCPVTIVTARYAGSSVPFFGQAQKNCTERGTTEDLEIP